MLGVSNYIEAPKYVTWYAELEELQHKSMETYQANKHLQNSNPLSKCLFKNVAKNSPLIFRIEHLPVPYACPVSPARKSRHEMEANALKWMPKKGQMTSEEAHRRHQ